MKERVITLVTALLALLLVWLFVIPHTPPQQQQLSLPTSVDRGPEGYTALSTWLERAQLSVQSWRKPFTALNQSLSLPATGNVMLLTLPTTTAITPNEWQALANWLQQGNTLLVMGEALRYPAWVKHNDCFCEIKSLLNKFDWTLHQAKHQPPETAETSKPAEETSLTDKLNNFKTALAGLKPEQSLLPVSSARALLPDITQLASEVAPALLKNDWQLIPVADTTPGIPAWQLLSTAPPQQPLAWQVQAGNGSILLLLTADLFSNKQLDKADNAKLFSQLLSRHLASHGQVMFADFHYGLSDLYDPQHFFKDARLHHSLALIGLFWLCYLLGHSPRLAPVRLPATRLTGLQMLNTTAGFFSRRLTKRQLAAALVSHLLLDLRKHRQLNEAEVWQWLAHHNRISAQQLKQLQQAYAQQAVSLLKLANTLLFIRTISL